MYAYVMYVWHWKSKRYIVEGSFEVKLPTIWTHEKQRWEESEKRKEERRSKKRKSQKKEDPGARKGKKVAKHCIFPMIWGSGGSKSRLSKAAGAELAGQMRDEKLHAVVGRSIFPSQNAQTHQVRTTFGSWDVEKVHAVVVRSTFWSQNVQNARGADHFWQLRCRKIARRCGAKHILKSKCTKHLRVGRLLEVEMSKKCTPLWRKAHFKVKMLKTLGVRTTFGGSDVASLRFTTIDYITLHYTPLHYNYYNATTLHYTKLHYTTLSYTTLHYTTLHYLPLHLTTLHYIITLHSTTLQLQLHNYTSLRYTTLHYTTFHYTWLHYTTLHYTTLHYTTLHYNYNYTTTLHYTPLH